MIADRLAERIRRRSPSPGRRVAGGVFAAAMTLLSTACLASAPRPVAIDAPERTARWVGLGVGAGGAGLSAQADYSHARDGRMVRGRIAGYTNASYDAGRESLDFTEFSVVVGKGGTCCLGNWGTVAIGGSVMNGSRGDAARGFTTFGLVGEAQVISARAPHLSAALFGSANPEQSFVGVSLSIAFGRMPFTTSAPVVRMP